MVKTVQYQQIILNAVLAMAQKDKQVALNRLKDINFKLKPDHFTPPYDLIYRALIVYYQNTEDVIPYDSFVDIVKRRLLTDSELNAAITSFVELRDGDIVDEAKFKFTILRLKEQTKSDRLAEALIEGMDILVDGKIIKGKRHFGFDASLTLLQSKLATLGSEEDNTPVFHHNKSFVTALTDYSDRKFGRTSNFTTGFDEIDEPTSGGFSPGNLVFLPGYTAEGKTTLLLSLVDRWVFGGQKLNVAFATAESIVKDVKRHLISIRSADPKYGIQPLSYKLIKEGRLSQSDERNYEMVVQDMSYCQNYGNLEIFSVPEKCTVTTMFALVYQINHLWPVDILAWDYIGYTDSEVKRDTDRESLGYVCKKTKIYAPAFDNKRGLVVVSPFAVSRGKWEKARTEGGYNLSCMAESSESEKAADIVWSVLVFWDQAKAVGQLLKNRDGERRMDPFEMYFDSVTRRYFPRPPALRV